MEKNIPQSHWRFGIGFAIILLAGIAVYALQSSSITAPFPPKNHDAQAGTTSHNQAASNSATQTKTTTSTQSPDNQETVARPTPSANRTLATAHRPVGKTITIGDTVYPLRTYQPLLTPNDPLGAQTWTDTSRFTQAWDVPAGTSPTVLAIIDTGFALNHEEFSNRWYQNDAETGSATIESASVLNCTDRAISLSTSCNLIDDNSDGIVDNETGPTSYENPSRRNCTAQGRQLAKDCNQIDDDGNGYIDDVSGWDFINGDKAPQAGQLNPTGPGTTHGTQVAGVAAATGNNNKGIAGANWQTKIMPLQALDDDAYGDTYSVGRAILYAASQKADVISISLGSVEPDPFVQQAIHTAIASGSIVVAASGNDGCNCMLYPANYPEVVAVGALDSSNQRASFSSWGSNIDIVAPGTNLTSTTWSASNPASAYAAGLNGTSFSTPLVSGLLTQLRSHQPTATQLQLSAALTENTNRLSIPSNLTRDTQLGFGSLDANKAVQRMTNSQASGQLYAFAPVSLGGTLSSLNPAEKIGNYYSTQCPVNTVGGTPIYRLSKASAQLLSISDAESFKATQDGYTSQLFTYVCLSQPHDTATSIRHINIFHEFYNIYPKQ